MEALYNDPVMKELNELITGNMNPGKIPEMGVRIKKRVLDMVNKNHESRLLKSYRYLIHLKNDLECKKRVLAKKKYQTSIE